MKNEPIDFVVAWVDGSDPVWRSKRDQYISDSQKKNPDVGGDKRFKDTGLFKYWFRAVEKYAPWVNKIYLVTDGQVPTFLNLNHPKIVLVNHKDIIDEKYLPIFNSSAICVSIGKIPNLSNNFVFFNDDMFLINNTKASDFFKNNLPRDMAVQGVLAPSNFDMFWKTRANLIATLNKNFNKKIMIRKHPFKWLNSKYPLKYNVRNIVLRKYPHFTDLYNPHVPHSYNKTSFEKVWKDNKDEMVKTLSCRFRKQDNLTEWLVRYYQLVEGNFVPTNIDKFGIVMDASEDNVDLAVASSKYKYICINNDADGEKLQKLIKAFESKLGKKSKFEI